MEASVHPAMEIGAAARIRTVNPLLTKQPRCRCATAARFRQPRYPDRMAPAGCTDSGIPRAVSGVFCSKLPIQKRTGCRWPLVAQPWTARRAFAPFQNAIPAALEGSHFFALRVVPCRPGRLRGTCRRVQLRSPDISISAIAILRDGHLGIGGTKGIRTLNFRLAKPVLCR